MDVQHESETPMVNVEVKPFRSTNIINGSGIGGFTCTFTNNTDKVAKVVWAESSVNYNGSSYVPFLDGKKYIQAQEPMAQDKIQLVLMVKGNNREEYITVKCIANIAE